MSTRFFIAMLVAITLWSTTAHAEWSAGAGIESYSWKESIQGSSLSLKESGSRYALNLMWMENGDRELLYSYSAKFYSGTVPYDTYDMNTLAPVSTQTDYSGMTHEGQLISRHALGRYSLDYVGGLGWDNWRRTIGHNQIEDYSIWFVRTGINLDQPMHGAGFHGGGGVKLPFSTNEDAHLDSAGFNSNPKLSPGKNVSLYAELAYRTGKYWDIVGYYDSWRFKQSEPVYVTSGGTLYSIVQPESSMDTFGLKALYSF